MNMMEYVLPVKIQRTLLWRWYLFDSLLAFAGSMLITGIIAVWQLYPRIPNISIIYLLVVLTLASTRGRYAATLASLVAFLSFDFFLVPPLYVFTISRVEEWIALFIFLVTAILTSQLAVALRNQAKEARTREQQTRILYDLVNVINREEEPKHQLNAITRAVVEVFSGWGVKDCVLLQPDATGVLNVQASSSEPVERVTLSADEQATAAWVVAHGGIMDLSQDTSTTPSRHSTQHIVVRSTATGRATHRSLRFIPLTLGQKVQGVLRLRLLDDARALPQKKLAGEDLARSPAPTAFFWTFLNQVAALVERARLQQENMRIEVLQRTDALRTALLSSVSHDLRTPLTSIKAAASSLLQQDVYWDEEERRGFAQTIEHEADRLNRLVGNLLDMSRIEEGALKPEKEQYSLVALVQDVLGRLEPLLAGRLVHMHLPSDLLLVEVDYLHLDQVLTNLMENAVRYTPPESPIDVSAKREGEQVILSVADRGPGVPLAEMTRIFDKFYRVQRRRSGGLAQGSVSAALPSPAGSGLGLAVCKGLAEANGGHIQAELREGGGLVVSVTLPSAVSPLRAVTGS
jgi:two-component system, OmpR family, sensor histidine kinase KdpD